MALYDVCQTYVAHTTHKTRIAAVRFTPEQYRLIERRAEKCGVPVGTWMRSILSHASTRQPDIDGYLRIREPDGATS